jgi:hypothetical protein
VFAEIAASAARLCDAYDVVIRRLDGDSLPVVAHHGPILTGGPFLTRGLFIARIVLDQRTIHVADLQAESNEHPEGRDIARRHGLRAVFGVPLIRAGEALGVIAIRRAEVRQFSDKQIAPLYTVFLDMTLGFGSPALGLIAGSAGLDSCSSRTRSEAVIEGAVRKAYDQLA